MAAGDVRPPRARTGRSPFTNVVRNELIIKTVQTLEDCGISATRNEGSDPEYACDAVSIALKAHGVGLEWTGVVKVWQNRMDQKEK